MVFSAVWFPGICIDPGVQRENAHVHVNGMSAARPIKCSLLLDYGYSHASVLRVLTCGALKGTTPLLSFLKKCPFACRRTWKFMQKLAAVEVEGALLQSRHNCRLACSANVIL